MYFEDCSASAQLGAAAAYVEDGFDISYGGVEFWDGDMMSLFW